jgi:hypothetical protein
MELSACEEVLHCVVCQRKKIVKNEGRIIDMTWHTDSMLPDYVKGKWVCCYNCYRKLINESSDKESSSNGIWYG